MIFSSTRMRQALAVVALVAGLAACGGGTEQVETFVPERLLVFGDENSRLTPEGRKYSVNGFALDDLGNEVADCSQIPNWVQSIAAFYGFVFAECNPLSAEQTKAVMLALEGARVEDIKIQLDQLIASGGFGNKDLATMLAGGNDIVELYQQYPVRGEPELIAEAGQRGRLLALQVNRLVEFCAKVIVSTVPDMGLTPYALKQRLEFADIDRAALLSRLTAAFNEQLGVNILLDGRFIGLVQGDLRTQAMARIPQAFGVANISDGACLPETPPPLCSTRTLVENGNPGSWMWADDLRLGYPVHQQLAALAIDRARRNPF